MKVIIYVEGKSDRLGMETLLRPLVEEKRQQGVDIQFYETPNGDRKIAVLTKVPIKAINILRNAPDSVVVALPDLYPRNKGFPHETVGELVEGVTENFRRAVRAKGADPRLADRFRVFCFKYDLEALLLASEEGLRRQLGVARLETRWRLPVEDQNHACPPKEVVKQLFSERGMRYTATLDAPLILGASNYQDLAARCPQCFGPFVAFLAGL
jgi:hypothetical protein